MMTPAPWTTGAGIATSARHCFQWIGAYRRSPRRCRLAALAIHRLVVRYDRYALNYLGFVHLGCILILLRQGL